MKMFLRCHWACAFTGRNGKRMQPKNLIILGKLEPSVGWNRSEYFFIFVSRTIQSYLDCILLEYSSLSWCTRAQMFYQLEGNETLSYNSYIFICIPSEPQWKMKDLYISNSSLRVDFLWRVIFTCLRALNLRAYMKYRRCMKRPRENVKLSRVQV